MTDFKIARRNMIQNQLMTNNITESNILNSMKVIPREIFLPVEYRSQAYLDEDIKISSTRFLVEPRIIGHIIKLSKIQKTDIVLDLACSSGYTTAVLSKLSKKVFGVDNKKELIDQAINNIKKLGIKNVNFHYSNLLKTTNMVFDIIFIFGGVEYIPNTLFNCLKNDGGRLITVFYDKNNVGKIHIIKKINGTISKKNYLDAQTPILGDFKKIKKEFIL